MTRAEPDSSRIGADAHRGSAPDPRRAGADTHRGSAPDPRLAGADTHRGSAPDPRLAGARQNRGPAAGPGNRAALIAAAREVYAEEGLSAPFSAVAKRAGVGQGSLYRHFPDRTTLAVAVFEDNLEELEVITSPADRTIDDLLDRVVAQAMVSTAFIDFIAADLHDPRVAPLGIRFREIVSRLLAREHALGRVGAHIDVEDVVMAAGMLATELARSDPGQRPQVARRARSLFRAAFAPR